MKEVRGKRRRLVSLTLACTMVLSMFSTIVSSGAAQAAEPELSPHADTASVTKPTLYIDFLGDNTSMFSGASPVITVPSTQDQSKFQEPAGPWEKYDADNYDPSTQNIIFWVAVGIDKLSVFELSKEGRGLTGLELGFYYNTKYVEPYYTDSYLAELTAANLSGTPNTVNQWNSNYYRITQAIPDRDIVSDPDTREFSPEGLPYAATDTWKMLYVSLEKYADLDNITTNRFSAVDNEETKYVMMLPFKLKAIDTTAAISGVIGSGPQLCFRLVRDAATFSMGGGSFGAGIYDDPNAPSSFGAWERETRTPHHNLKEMFDFEGDLNIFTGVNETPSARDATLSAPNASLSNGNTATLSDGLRIASVDNPSPGRDTLEDVQAGLTMTLTVNKNTGTTTTTSITLTPGNSSTPVPKLTPVSTSPGQDVYTFLMPADDITVEVIYDTDPSIDTTYNAKLVLVDTDSMTANTAVLAHLDDTSAVQEQTDLTVTPAKDLLDKLPQGAPMKVDVLVHPDYTATVEVTRRSDPTVKIGTVSPGLVREIGTDRWERHVTFNMPSGNVDATVTYAKRPTHYAELGVNYDGTGDSRNQATLSYRDYTNAPSGNYTDGETKSIMVNGKGANKRLENVPTGRQLTLEVTVLNDYEIDEAWLYNADDSTVPPEDLKALITAGTPVSSTPDTRTYRITVNSPVSTTAGMPDNNIQVMVRFRQSNDYNLHLRLEGAGNLAANTATLSGEDKNSVTKSVTRVGTDGTAYDSTLVYSGNTVSATWGEAPGYHVESVSVYRDRDENVLLYRYATENDLNDLKANGFKMPTGDTWVVVKFHSENYTATMVPVNNSGTPTSSGYTLSDGGTGWVEAAGVVVYPLTTSPEGGTVTGKMTVLSGWRIGDHRIVGKTTGQAYTFTTFSGDGYNNGAGGVVDMTFPQPGEDVWVYLELLRGAPTPEPELSLTLNVRDDDNTTGADENWAQIIEVDGTPVTSARPIVRKTVSAPNEVTSDLYKPLTAGQWVTVRVNVASGYRLKQPTSVTISPNPPFGATIPVWDPTDPSLFRVQIPTGSMTATVEFEKIDPNDPRPQTATLYITDSTTTGGTNTATLTNTDNAASAPANSTSTHTGTVAFATGENFLLQVFPAPGCKAVAKVVNGGSNRILSLSDPAWAATFQGLNGDADVFVTFVDEDEDLTDKYMLTLNAVGPDGVGDAGYADLAFGASTVGPAQSNGAPVSAMVKKGETVTLTATPQSGYSLDYISYVRNGAVITAPVTSNGSFTMPAEALDVTVHFRTGDEARNHTANIVLWLENAAGTATTPVNTAVVGDAGFGTAPTTPTVYSVSAASGDHIDVWGAAQDGYYISRIEITPTILGETGTYTGSFVSTDVDFTMPDADVKVNVYFKAGFVNDADLTAKLTVTDPAELPGNHAQFADPVGSGPLTNGMSDTVTTHQSDKVKVDASFEPLYTCDTIIKDISGTLLSPSQYRWYGSTLEVDMPINPVTIELLYHLRGEDDKHEALLHYEPSWPTAAEYAEISAAIDSVVVTKTGIAPDDGCLKPLYQMEQVDILIHSVDRPVLTVVSRSTGLDNTTLSTLTNNRDGTWSASFTMQDDDADIYVVFPMVEPPTEEHELVTLVATGPSGVGKTGEATLSNPSLPVTMPPTPTSATAEANPTGLKTLYAKPGDLLTIDATPEPGYMVASIILTDAQGNTTTIGGSSLACSYTFPMPVDPNDGPAKVTVTFAEEPADGTLEAKLSVNNGGDSRNKAELRNYPLPDGTPVYGTLSSDKRKITGLSLGDGVYIDITSMAPGYKAKISVFPVGSVTTDVTKDRSFLMPGMDVEVLVEFEDNGLDRYDISLAVTTASGSTVDNANTASLTTPLTATQGPIYTGQPSVHAQAQAGDQVTIDLSYDQTKYKAVATASGAITGSLPLSPDKTQVTFTAANGNVDVVVTYYDKDKVPSYDVTLHLLDKDLNPIVPGAWSAAQLADFQRNVVSWGTLNTDVAQTPPTLTIQVPYGETVHVEAFGSTLLSAYGYVKEAYATWGSAPGTMLTAFTDGTPITLGPQDTYTPAGSGTRVSRIFDFTMQMAQADVFIVLDDVTNAPLTPEYTARLVVTGPATGSTGAAEPVGAAGSATLARSSTTTPASVTMKSNEIPNPPGSNTITVAESETLTLTVTVNPGYKLDLVTAISTGVSLTPDSTSTDITTGVTVYTYTMPAADVDVKVDLVRDPDTELYRVTLDLIDPGSANATNVHYSTYSATKDKDNFPVPAGQTVTIDLTAGADSYIKNVYVTTVGGKVQKVTVTNPAGRPNLQNYGSDDSVNPVNGVATFVMPAEDVIVHVVYEKDTNPPTGDLTAVVTMFDPGNTGTSTVTMSRTSSVASVSAVSDGVTSSPLSVYPDEHVTIRVNPASGYKVAKVELTGGGLPDVLLTATDLSGERYEFDMPSAPGYDVGVVVTLEQTEEDTFTATLVTVDHTSALGNTTSMKVQGTAGVGVVWAGTITDLAGNETIVTTVSPEEGVRVAAVLATDAKGTRRLSQGSTVNTYNYPMSSDTGDVTITVVLDNVDTPHMHVVNVVKGTGAELTGNDVTDLTNTTNPALPGGTLWVGAYENNVVTLDVTTASGSYAKVTAVDSHGNTVPVTQQGLTGNVKAWLETPDDDVTVTVDWTDTPPTLQDYTLTLEVEGDTGLQFSGTRATLTGGTDNLLAPNNKYGPVMSNTDATTATEGTPLTLAESLFGYFVQKITLISGGVELDLPVDTASLVMPSANTTVRVTFAAGEQTARPYDENQDPNTKGYTLGYLIADNPGFNHLEITVPNLYPDAGPMATVPDTTVFNLYYKNGGAAIRLIPGVDYDVTTGPTPYTHGGFTGQRFTIRSLKGESPLTHVTVNGGLLYITATDPVTPKAESRLVEVEVPADPYLGGHKAILKVIDSSGVSGNLAEMNVVAGTTGLSTTVTNAGTIIGLLGDERVRTMAKAAPGARVSAVTATVLDSTGAPIGGSTLLGRVPDGYLSDGSQRFPFDMTGEDVLITVYFESDGLDPNDPTRYIASVEKRGAIGVPGNDATVINDARNDLLKGQIWAEGLEGNGMKATVTTAPGYYADVTVVNKWTGAPVAPSVTGVGNGVPFDVTFDMPAADVQITVTFSTDPPKNASNKLILKVTDPYGKLGNEATLTWNGSGSPLQANGSSPITDSTAAGEEVPVGTPIKVDTLAALITDTTTTPPTVLEDYFVKQVIVTWNDGTLSGSQAVTMSLPAGAPTGSHALEGSFLMQKGETTVEVIFEKGPRSPRPADPAHSETYTDNTYTLPDDHQKGWIGAVTLSDDPALPGKIQITVPTLFDDSLPTPEERLLDAIEQYKLYWKDKSGFYHELVPGTHITISNGILLPDENTYTYTGSTGPVTQTFDAYRFEVEPIYMNSELDYYIKNGGVIYITATTADRPESDYTEVWITKAYKATLVFEPNGASATLLEPGGRFVNTDGAVLGGLADGTTVTVKDTVADPGYTVLGVVATTVSGSVNVPVSITGEYDYTISGADVELRVVYEKDDDPLKSKGPWIVTVQKKGDDGLAGNTASVEDTSVPIPPEQKGNIWTAAYEGNVVRIDVGTEPGYHAEITAVIKGTTTEVKVVPFVDDENGGYYGLLYMPRDHVDVTVEYKKGPPDPHALTLTVTGPGGPGDYTTTINPTGMTGVFISGNYDKHPVPGDGSLVPAGTELNLSTSVAGAYSVASVVMVVNGISIDIPLTDGSAWPLPKMPVADAEIIVTYVVGEQTARPYDPAHANRYTPSYTHGSTEDVSRTHQDGWIQAVSSGTNKITITVPTLHDKKGGSDNLYDADDTTYKLYWRDNMGAFRPLTVGSDITISDGQTVPGAFTYGGTVYDGYKFTVTIRNPQTLWGGYTLDDYMTAGGSIYITATGGGSGANESEKTEVVIPPRDGTLIATFYVVDNTTDTTSARTHTLDDNLGHIVTDDGQQITQLRGGETMTTTVDVSALSPEAEVQSVTVTTASGGTTFVAGGNVSSATPNAYVDRMPDEDADYTVILRDKDSDVYTAAVKVVDPAGAPGNTADIENSDDPTAPTGNIWAVGHGSVDENGVPNGETMVVSFNTDTSDPTVTYYANVTAVLASDGVTPVPILQLGVTGSGTAYFDMPDDNVQVTVTFTTTPPPDVPLLLTLSGHDQKAGNYAMVDWTDSASAPKSLMATGGMAPNASDYTVPRKDGAESLDMLVTPGTSLSIITGHDPNYIVESIKIKDELSGYELTLPMTVGAAGTLMPVILQSTPKAARITVTYKPGQLTPRPYNPEHDPYYSSATPQYAHNTDDDLSRTHQDGWLLADNLGGGSIQITVHVLARDVEPETTIETDPDTGESKLVQKPVPEPNQYPLFDVLQEHTFDLYLYNEIADTYTRLVAGVDYDMSAAGITLLPGYYTDPVGNPSAVPPVAPGTQYVGAQFTVSEVPGGKLEGLLARGGISLYITATNTDATAEPPWFESDRTELVIPSVGLVPYDPNRVGDPTKTYEDHWIRAENWGDYLTVTVPTLNKTKDGPVTDVEDVNGNAHDFHFYLQPDGTDRTSDMVDVTSLIRLTNYDKFFDETWTAPTPGYKHQEEYKTDVFYTVPGSGTDPDRDVTGARFVLEVLTNDEINDLFADPTSTEASDAREAADILRKIMDNSGTMKDAASTEDEDKRRLYITVVDDADPSNPQEGEKVDFQVPQYYTFTGELQSWAPTHTAELSIYRWDTSAATPDYESKPFLTVEVGLDPAQYDPALYNGHWEQSFTFKSSELAGETFKLEVRKTAHIPYDHVGLVMDPDLTTNAQYTESGRNDETAKVFTLAGPISLFCGDLDPIFPGPDGKIDDLDRNLLAGFLYLEYDWNTDTEGDPGWDLSVFNPDSYAYAADLDGDGLITDLDMAILMYDYNFGRWQEDYGAPVGLDHVPTGYAVPFSEEFALLDLTEAEALPAEGEEAPPEGEEVPTEGEETPPEGEEVPAEGEETPPEGEEVPAEGEEVPPEDEEVPSEGEEVPAEGEDPAPTPEPAPEPDPEPDPDPEPNPEPEADPDPEPDPEADPAPDSGEGEEDISNEPQNPENEDQNPENEGQNDPKINAI